MAITSNITGTRRPGGVRGTGMVPVANMSTAYPAGAVGNNPSGGGGYTHMKYVATADVSAIRLVYGNFFDAGTVAPIETSTGNLITVRSYIMVGPPGQRVPSVWKYVSAAATWSSAGSYVVGDMVRMTGGFSWVATAASTNQSPVAGSAFWAPVQYWPVHYPGESATRDVTIQPLNVVISDPVIITPLILKGESFYVITLVQPNNGTANTGVYPLGADFDTSVDWAVGLAAGTAPTDYTTAPPASQQSAASGTKNYGPMSVIGAARVPNQIVVYLVGDSIMNGALETVKILSNETAGWGLRMLTDNPTTPTKYLYGHYRSAKGSSTGNLQYGPGNTLRLAIAGGCTHIVDEYGVNDIGQASLSLAQIQANAINRWTTYKALGLTVYATTITPSTTSTDAWVTVGNQTPQTNFGASSKWSQYNDWIKTLPAPLDGYIDVAAAVLDPSGTVWKANYTTDGIHPTTAAHTAIANSIPVAALFGPPA